MTWTAKWSNTAIKQLKKFPIKDRKRILLKTIEVEEDPFSYISRLEGSPLFRYRVGGYRVILSVVNDQLLLQIVKVAKHSRVYD